MIAAESEPRRRSADLAIVGAGPAGMSAAIRADRCGLKAVLLDEAPEPGGQVYRALPAAFRVRNAEALGEDYVRGQDLRTRLAASGVEILASHTVWNVSSGFTIQATGAEGPVDVTASALISATGARELVFPFPGWTMPGVIGLAAATLLLKSQQMLPGRRTLVAGGGPLLYAVAAGILKAGGTLVAVVDNARTGEWLRVAPALALRPDLAARGIEWLARIRRAGVPILFGSMLLEVRGAGEVTEAIVGPVGVAPSIEAGARVRSFAVDSVATGEGLLPNIEIAALLNAELAFDPGRGGWFPVTQADGSSSVPQFYVAGDGAGIAGAIAAEHAGAVAALAAARDLGTISRDVWAVEARQEQRAQRRAVLFGKAMARMMRPRPERLAAATDETIICRCEGVGRREIEAAIKRGARTLNEVKSWTRCGMGPCQGRFCSEAAAQLVALKTGDRVGAGRFTVRFPIRPVSVGELIGPRSSGDQPLDVL